MDGVLESTDTSSIPTSISPTATYMNIGRGGDGGGSGKWNGAIDEVRIYNRTLSPTEINQSYQRGLLGLKSNTSTSDLVSYWDFENNETGEGVYDDKYGSNDGTANEDVYTTEYIGGMGVFDGNGDYVSVNDDASLSFGDEIKDRKSVV